MRWFKGECSHFSCSKCPIYTHDGASANFSTNSHETDNNKEWTSLTTVWASTIQDWTSISPVSLHDPRVDLYKSSVSLMIQEWTSISPVWASTIKSGPLWLQCEPPRSKSGPLWLQCEPSRPRVGAITPVWASTIQKWASVTPVWASTIQEWASITSVWASTIQEWASITSM